MWDPKHGIFFDAEFTGLHRKTSLISIGMISESKRFFYAEFTDYDRSQVTPWIQRNVIDKLIFNNIEEVPFMEMLEDPKDDPDENIKCSIMMKAHTSRIRTELTGWLHNESYEAGGKQLQMYTDCYAYDWMLLNDLIGLEGNALDIPAYVYYIPVDLSTMLFAAGVDPDINREEFCGVDKLATIRSIRPFCNWGGSMTHNSLYDAYVAAFCFARIVPKDIIPGQAVALTIR
jgi:hypothetical protein